MKIDIILAGVGGQGILSIATIVGAAAIKRGMYMKQAEVHGMSQRGGDVQSHFRLSDQPIASDLIPLGKADMIISVEPMESLRYLPWLKKLLEQNPPEEHATILLREADLKQQAELEQAITVPVSFRADPSILLGGLSVLSADGRRCRNHTLDEAYAEQLRNFYRNHKIDGGNE